MARGVSKKPVKKGEALDGFKLGLELGKKPRIDVIRAISFKEKAWDAVEKAAEWLSEQLQAKSLYYGAKLHDFIESHRPFKQIWELQRKIDNPALLDKEAYTNWIAHLNRADLEKRVKKLVQAEMKKGKK